MAAGHDGMSPGGMSPGGMSGRPRAEGLDDAVREARESYAERRPRTLELHRQAEEFLPGGNTRTVLYHPPFPLRVVRGWDAVLEDADGLRYVDMLGEYSAGLFGHSHPVVVEAMVSALAEGIGRGAHNQREILLAQAVCDRFGLDRVRFTNSGTEANLMAIAAARSWTERDTVVVCTGAYHGGVLSYAHGDSRVNAPFDVLIVPYNDAEAAAAAIRGRGAAVACVLVEPMLGSGGCIPAQGGFLAALRQAADDVGALLILDEVMTSRYGEGGLGAAMGIRPDLMTLGKYLGGGSSFGAFGGRADVMGQFDPSRADALAHAGTFNNNVVSMAAGLAALQQVYTKDVAARHTRRGLDLMEKLQSALRDSCAPLQVTGAGSIMAFHATDRCVARPEDLDDADPRLLELLFLGLLDEGYYIAPRGYLALSLAVTDEQRDGFVAAVGMVAARLPS